MGERGGPHLDLDFNLGGAFFWDSFSILGQDLKTYHHVMLNLSSLLGCPQLMEH
jgi:hypothetical protein